MINIEELSEKKILLVDDEIEILELLEAVLIREGFKNIHKATTGLEAIELCKTAEPHIIILDIMLPDIDGFEVCRRIREFSIVPIIFLSAKSDDLDKLLGLGIGGDDYVTKPFSPKEVAFRIKAFFRRSGYLEGSKSLKKDDKFTFGDVEIDYISKQVKKQNKIVSLTAKEYQILEFITRHGNHILSKNKIYDAVWGEEFIGDDNAIMVHIRHLREKLEDDPGSPKYIKTIKGLGYKLSIGEE